MIYIPSRSLAAMYDCPLPLRPGAQPIFCATPGAVNTEAFRRGCRGGFQRALLLELGVLHRGHDLGHPGTDRSGVPGDNDVLGSLWASVARFCSF